MDVKQEIYQVIRVYQKIGIVEFATAVYVVPILVDGEILFKVVEVRVPMMGEFILN